MIVLPPAGPPLSPFAPPGVSHVEPRTNVLSHRPFAIRRGRSTAADRRAQWESDSPGGSPSPGRAMGRARLLPNRVGKWLAGRLSLG